MDDIKELVRGRWLGIFSNLGIDVGTGKHKSCPVCGGKDRFRLMDEDGSGSWFCNQGHPKQSGDGWDLLLLCLHIDFAEATKVVEKIIGSVPKKAINNGLEYKPERLRKMYKDSKPLDGQCLGSMYLRNRGLSAIPSTLRLLDECYEPATRTKMPALLATFSAPDSEALTLHRTYLKPGGYKADLEHCKLTLTPKKPMAGGAVRLFTATDNVGVAEGVETAIAAHEIFNVPVWATLSTSLMERFQPPKGILNIMIFSDSDKNYAGQKAAYTLANSLFLKGYSVDVDVPPKLGDWLDVLNERRQNG